MNVETIIKNSCDVGGLLAAVAIIASWTSTWGPTKKRGFKSEIVAYFISNLSLGLAWISLLLLLIYCFDKKTVLLFCMSYWLIILSTCGQLYTFLYFQISPTLISARQREKEIKNLFFSP